MKEKCWSSKGRKPKFGTRPKVEREDFWSKPKVAREPFASPPPDTVSLHSVPMETLIVIAAVAITTSLIADRRKTLEGLRRGLLIFLRILPAIGALLVFLSIVLYLLPSEVIVEYLGEEAGIMGHIIAAVTGSVALMPGFIAYPLAAVLVRSGVSYAVIAVFITTLMMVGILTLPIEIRFFGVRIALVRNLFYLIGALIIGVLTGLFYML